jgi:nitroreductase
MSAGMTVSEAVESRRSTRAFLEKSIDKDLLVRVLEKARRSPSGGNVQPWNAVVLSGAPLSTLIEQVQERAAAESEEPEYPIYPHNLPEPYRSRRFGCGEQLYASIGISREDKPARLNQLAKNFAAFGAPVLLFCYTPRYMDKPQWSDLGMWLQTIMLLLKEEGIDSCAQEAWSSHGATIRSHLGIDDEFILFCGLAIGYADSSAPINGFATHRAPLDETIRFEGF